jgi:hypothetical protein
MNSCSVELWNVLLGKGGWRRSCSGVFVYASFLIRQISIFRFLVGERRLFGRMTDHGGVCQDQSGHE